MGSCWVGSSSSVTKRKGFLRSGSIERFTGLEERERERELEACEVADEEDRLGVCRKRGRAGRLKAGQDPPESKGALRQEALDVLS